MNDKVEKVANDVEWLFTNSALHVHKRGFPGLNPLIANEQGTITTANFNFAK